MANYLSKKGDKNPYYKDGRSNTKLYKTYWAMINRCNNIKMKSYPRYGGRGIKVCDTWMDDFLNFKEWALNNGYSEKLTLDRIDNNGNYEPSNCRWVSIKEQCNNRSTNHKVIINNISKGITEWCKIYNVPLSTVLNRISKGYSDVDALTMPYIRFRSKERR